MDDKKQVTLVIDPERCVGHGRCYRIAPRLFAPADDEGRAGVLTAIIADDQRPLAELALQSCPESAIALIPVSS